MELTRENLNSLFYSICAAYNRGIGKVWPGYEKFCMPVTSSTAMEKYPMMLLSGAMREWFGERVVNEINGKLITVRNRDFEHTEGVSRNDIEDDQIGFFAPLFEAIGIEAGNLWGRLATEALTSPGTWADDAAFFGSRKIGKATINNLVSGALNVSNYETARARMMDFKAADGKTPLGLVPDLIIVGNALEATAKRIFNVSLVSDGTTTVGNIHENEVEILIDPFLTGNDWFLACTNQGVKPLAVQKRKVGALVRWDKDSDDCVKNGNRNEYGIHSRGAAACVAPHLIIKGAAA